MFTVLLDKVSEPLNSITGQTFFGSSNLSGVIPVAVDQTGTTFGRKFESFFLIEVPQLSYILRMSNVNGSLEVITASSLLGYVLSTDRATPKR